MKKCIFGKSLGNLTKGYEDLLQRLSAIQFPKEGCEKMNENGGQQVLQSPGSEKPHFNSPVHECSATGYPVGSIASRAEDKRYGGIPTRESLEANARLHRIERLKSYDARPTGVGHYPARR